MGAPGDQGEQFIDNQRIEGTIPQMLEEALRFIRRNNAVRTIIDPLTGRRIDKTEYPAAAIREIVLNALIHRDYSIHTDTAPITIQIYRNRLVVENPGGLYGRLTLDTLGAVSADTRNPFLAGAMEVLGLTENRFSGIPRIRNSMKAHGLPPPRFEVQRGGLPGNVVQRRAAKGRNRLCGDLYAGAAARLRRSVPGRSDSGLLRPSPVPV